MKLAAYAKLTGLGFVFVPNVTEIVFSRRDMFLADRTIGRAFGTACRLSVLSSVTDETAGPICVKFSGKV